MEKLYKRAELTLKEPLTYQMELKFDKLGQRLKPRPKLVPRHFSRQLRNLLKREEEGLKEVSKFLHKSSKPGVKTGSSNAG